MFLFDCGALIALRAACEQLRWVKRMKLSRPHLSEHANKNCFSAVWVCVCVCVCRHGFMRNIFNFRINIFRSCTSKKTKNQANNQHNNSIEITARRCHIKSKPVFSFTWLFVGTQTAKEHFKSDKVCNQCCQSLAAAQSNRLKYLTRL